MVLFATTVVCEVFTPVTVGSAAPDAGTLSEQRRPVDPSLSAGTTPWRAEGETATHLTRAAAQLQSGDEVGACAHLALYLASHPEHTAVRAHFAELLLRQNRTDSAREQFERFEAEAQEHAGIPLAQRVRCEGRLAWIAEQQEDEYAEHLHRGMGLYLLAQERRGQGDDRRELSVEGLLFKAASELTQARLLNPSEARPNLYLYEVWSSLSQRNVALRRLRAAETAAPFSYLTPAEQRDLLLARQRVQRPRDL